MRERKLKKKCCKLAKGVKIKRRKPKGVKQGLDVLYLRRKYAANFLHPSLLIVNSHVYGPRH